MAITGHKVIRASATLTNSYVASTEVTVGKAKTIILYVDYTMGTAETSNCIDIKVEWSMDDGTTYYVDSDYSSDVNLISGLSAHKASITYWADSAAATYDYLAIPIRVMGKKLKVSVKESGVASNYGTAKLAIAEIE